MGVALVMHVDDREEDITPGARSVMHQLLRDEHLLGMLTEEDMPALDRAMAGQPNDTSERSIRANLQRIVEAIHKHGSVVIEAIL